MASNSSTPSASDLRDSRWYFTPEQLAQSPSRKHGINADHELFYRQQTADLIQKMGQKLQVSQLCINTAIVYMHRFYAFHSFSHFHRNGIATASLFLAAKVEEQPRKLEHVIKVAHFFLGSELPQSTTEVYNEQAQDLVFNENVLLQTLGFDVAIDHPHTHVVRTCTLVKACKDLAQTSYFLASNSLHLTPMCLQYKPTVVACFCIYLACKWSRWEIPQSTEGKHWFHYVDSSVTLDLLKQLTDEFLAIYEKSPARLTSKLNSIEKFAQGARMSESIPITDAASAASSQLSELQPRRPESYTSHHRRHSASSHHNHHSKQLPTNESGVEHAKPPASHKQPYNSTSASHSNRPRPDRPPLTGEGQFNVPAHGSSKQSVPPSVPRPSNSNRPPHSMPAVVAGNSAQRVPHAHDPNYHKNRGSMPPQMNPAVSGHKSMPKPNDPQRNVIKDPSGRPIDPNKLPNKHSSGNNSSTSNNGSNSNIFPATNTSAAGIDMTRNVLQMQGSLPIQQQQQQQQQPQQRPYIQPSNSQPPNYNQAISNRSSSNSAKYDQSVQQQMHLQSGQKQSLESSFSASNSRLIDEGNIKVEQMEICSPPKYPFSQPPPHPSSQQIPPQTSQSKSSSIFSPEWNEKGSHSTMPNMNMKTNNVSGSNNSKAVGLTIKTNRDSPKKRSETPKKDKNRSDQQLQDANKLHADKRSINRAKVDPVSAFPLNQNMPAYDGKIQSQQVLNLSGMKRPIDSGNRTDDDREFKVRKVEPQSPSKLNDPRSFLNFDQHSNDSRSMKSFPPTVNGIETDPDLVRNLLKESLCNENKFSSIKTEPLLDMVDIIKPIEPITDMDTLPDQLLQYESPIKDINEDATTLVGGEDFSKSKAEKKKKKDKHKHKEKDKSKDKEEKKKHKKDKDKHKERERSSGNELEQNHVKLTIPKEKLNLPILDANPPPPTSDLKIKIPKDRIRAELTNYQLDDSMSSNAPTQHSSLKIKISKDKFESYSHQQPTSLSSGNNYHSHSSKKKDRDKERVKDKKRNSNEHNKQNGGGGSGALSESSSSSSSTKNQSSNKMQYSSNMSQLFGDINDDDLQRPPLHHQQQQRFPHSDKYSLQYHK